MPRRPGATVLWNRELRPSTETAILLALVLSIAVFAAMVVVVIREYRAGAIATPFDAVMYGCLPTAALTPVCMLAVHYLSTGGTASIDPVRSVLIFERCPRSGVAFPPYVRRREVSFHDVRWVSYHGPIVMRRGALRERLTVRFGANAVFINEAYGTGLQGVAESIAEQTGAPLRLGPEPRETRNDILLAVGLLVIGACIMAFALRGQFPAPTPPAPRTARPPAAPAPAP